MSLLEIEIKFPLFDMLEVKDKLNNLAVQDKINEYQRDIYYVPAHRNFLDKETVNERLRFRESKKGYLLTYKNYYTNEGQKTSMCDEYETSIGDLNAMKNIFNKLDFREAIIVEKTRNTWIYKNVEIAIDQVIDLGDFIELEAKLDFENRKQAEDYLHNILHELNINVGPQDFRGYPYLLIEKKG